MATFQSMPGVSIQLCMQYLDITSLLKLGRCSKILNKDANSRFAFKGNSSIPFVFDGKSAKSQAAPGLIRNQETITVEGLQGVERFPEELRAMIHHLDLSYVSPGIFSKKQTVNKQVAHAVKLFPNLESIDLSGTPINWRKLITIQDFGLSVPSLTSISLNGCTFSGYDGRFFARFVHKHPTLRHLDLSHCPRLLDFMQESGSFPDSNNTLQTLKVVGCYFNLRENARALAQTIGNYSALTSLDMSRCRHVEMREIIPSLSRCKNLSHLDVSDLTMQDIDARNFGRFIAESPSLTWLRLRRCCAYINFAFTLANAIFEHQGPSKLQHLDLGELGIDKDSVHDMWRIIKGLPHLQTLILSDNHLNETVIGGLLEHFGTHLPELQSLDLSRNPLGSRGIGIVAEAVRRFPQLQLLNISDCKKKGERKVTLRALDLIRELAEELRYRCRVIG
jgi:Leucine-rich repeat (LRR) protein